MLEKFLVANWSMGPVELTDGNSLNRTPDHVNLEELLVKVDHPPWMSSR